MSGMMFSKYNPDSILSPDADREIDRIKRESELIEQRDRQPIVEADRDLPVETPIDIETADNSMEKDINDLFWESLMKILQRELE